MICFKQVQDMLERICLYYPLSVFLFDEKFHKYAVHEGTIGNRQGVLDEILEKLKLVWKENHKSTVIRDENESFFCIFGTTEWLCICGPVDSISETICCNIFDLIRIAADITDEWSYITSVNMKIEIDDEEAYRFRKYQQELKHISYKEELKWFDFIRNGQPEHIVGQASFYTGDGPGIVADNQKKQAEYNAVSAITLSARAAIDGGVSAPKAYEKSDLLMQELAKTTSLHQKKMMTIRAMKEFAEMVKDRKNSKSNNYVEQCKDYVALNYQKDFSVKDIATALGLNESYLCRLFKEAEGVTLGQYIQQEKMKIAKHMLKNSDIAIVDIAEYLGYHSQSYFGKQFLKWCNMTPSKYRMSQRAIDF